jgi:hypothetical protein
MIETKLVLITPPLAEQWLALNKNNRPTSPKRVAFYARQFKEGKARITHQGIAFYEDGTLADGQTRLKAIVVSGVAVRMLVTTGLDKSAIHAIDLGRSRSTRDVLHFQGMSVSSQFSAAGTALRLQKFMCTNKLQSWQNYPADTEEFSRFMAFVMPALEFGAPSVHGKGLSHSCVHAAISSAWFTQDIDRLKRFKLVFGEGMDATRDEQAALKLRAFMQATKITTGGMSQRQEIFMRSCTAIRAFLDGRQISRLYANHSDAFPIPDNA